MKSPTITIRGPGPRLSYAAVIEGLTSGEVPRDHHINLWNLIVAAHLRERPSVATKPPGVRLGRPGWTAEADWLISPLRHYVRDLKARRNAFHLAHRGLRATDRDGTEYALPDVYDEYVARCETILASLRSTLRAYGHLSNDATGSYNMSVKDIVTDLRTQGRPAGVHHWSQWEDPATRRRITYLMGQMYKLRRDVFGETVQGRRWYAYDVGVKAARSREEWTAAFTQWRSEEYTHMAAALDKAKTQGLPTEPYEQFIAVLNAPRLRQECEDAMHAMRALGHTPKRYPLEPWRALSLPMRNVLARAHQDVVDLHIEQGIVPSTSVSFYQPSQAELEEAGISTPA